MSRTELPSQLLTESDCRPPPAIKGFGTKLTAPGVVRQAIITIVGQPRQVEWPQPAFILIISGLCEKDKSGEMENTTVLPCERESTRTCRTRKTLFFLFLERKRNPTCLQRVTKEVNLPRSRGYLDLYCAAWTWSEARSERAGRIICQRRIKCFLFRRSGWCVGIA